MEERRVYFDSTVNPTAIMGIVREYKKQFKVIVLMQSKNEYRILFYYLIGVKVERMNWRQALKKANVIITKREKLGRVFKRYQHKIAVIVNNSRVRLWKNRKKDN